MRSLPHSLLLSAALALACSPSASGRADSSATVRATPTDTAAAIRGIDSVAARMTTAVNQQDLTGVLGGMADDYVSLENPDEIIRGKTAYRTMLDSMAAAGKWQDLAFQTEGITVSGDLAVEHGRWRMTFVPKTGRPVPSAGNFVHVWRRQADGSWKLFRDISNSVPPSDSVAKPR